MSHVKRVHKLDGVPFALICTKWQFENDLQTELRAEIIKMATATHDLVPKKEKKGKQKNKER